MLGLHLASVLRLRPLSIALPPLLPNPDLTFTRRRARRRYLPNNACDSSRAHGRPSYCAKSHATANFSRSRSLLVSPSSLRSTPGRCRHHPHLPLHQFERIQGSTKKIAPSPRQQNRSVVSDIALFQLLAFPLLVSCQSGLAVRIRPPARISHPTAFSHVFTIPVSAR